MIIKFKPPSKLKYKPLFQVIALFVAFEIIEENDPRYDPNKKFLNFEWVPTGQHGKYQPFHITKYVEVYPANWKGEWEDWPRLRIHFKHGILQDYERITR